MPDNPFMTQPTENPFMESKENPFVTKEPEGDGINFSPAMDTVKQIGQVYPVLEGAANLISSAIAAPVVGLVGLGALATKAVGLTDKDPSEVMSSVGSALTYAPLTSEGREFTETTNYPFHKLEEFGGLVGDKTFEATGSPAAATVAHTVAQLGPLAAIPAGKGAVVKVEEIRERYKSKVPEGVEPVKEFIEPLKEVEVPSNFPATDIPMPNKAFNINLEKIEAQTDVKAAIHQISEVFKSTIDDARRGTITHEETAKLAEHVNMTPDKLLSRRKGQAFSAEEALASRMLLVDSADVLMNKAKAAQLGSKDDLVAFQEQFIRHVAIQEQVSGMTAEAGRALNQFKITVESEKARIKSLEELIDNQGGRVAIEDMAAMIRELDSPEKISKFTQDAYKATTSDMLLEGWINALLSGPQTHAVNITSNALVSMWTLPEHTLSAAIGKFHKGEKASFREPLSRLYGMIEGAKEGFVAGGRAFLREEPSDLFSKLELKHKEAIPGKAGKAVRIPGRALMAEDEFFKAIGYRMELNALAIRQGLKEGLKGKELASRITELKRNPPEEIHLASIDNARYQTFTKPLGPTGQSVMKFANSHPAARLIIPFIRTPTNIVKFAGERSGPLALMSQKVRAEIKKGGISRDNAIAKMTMGSIVGGTIASLASEGLITGGGTKNPEARAMKYASGWQPYSIKVGGKYYSYSRLEPLGMMLGISADYAEIAGEVKTKEADELAAMITLAISNNLTSKTWLRGVSDLIEAVNDPNRYGEKWIQSFSGTLIPTGVAQIARNEDPVMRRTETIVDRIKSRIPGYSKDLPPRRNIWGEPIILSGGLGPDLISPVYVSADKNDTLTNEMLRLKITPKMPDKKIKGIELSSEQYDDYAKTSGKNLKMVLGGLVASGEWAKLPDFAKTEIINKTITQVRSASRSYMLSKYPDIINKYIEQEKTKLR